MRDLPQRIKVDLRVQLRRIAFFKVLSGQCRMNCLQKAVGGSLARILEALTAQRPTTEFMLETRSDRAFSDRTEFLVRTSADISIPLIPPRVNKTLELIGHLLARKFRLARARPHGRGVGPSVRAKPRAAFSSTVRCQSS